MNAVNVRYSHENSDFSSGTASIPGAWGIDTASNTNNASMPSGRWCGCRKPCHTMFLTFKHRGANRIANHSTSERESVCKRERERERERERLEGGRRRTRGTEEMGWRGRKSARASGVSVWEVGRGRRGVGWGCVTDIALANLS